MLWQLEARVHILCATRRPRSDGHCSLVVEIAAAEAVHSYSSACMCAHEITRLRIYDQTQRKEDVNHASTFAFGHVGFLSSSEFEENQNV